MRGTVRVTCDEDKFCGEERQVFVEMKRDRERGDREKGEREKGREREKKKRREKG